MMMIIKIKGGGILSHVTENSRERLPVSLAWCWGPRNSTWNIGLPVFPAPLSSSLGSSSGGLSLWGGGKATSSSSPMSHQLNRSSRRAAFPRGPLRSQDRSGRGLPGGPEHRQHGTLRPRPSKCVFWPWRWGLPDSRLGGEPTEGPWHQLDLSFHPGCHLLALWTQLAITLVWASVSSSSKWR